MAPVPEPDLPPDPALDSRLAELRTRFKCVLPERIAGIRTRLDAMSPDNWSGQSAEELRTEVHSLAGSSGLFGFDQVGAAAAEFERLLIAASKHANVSHAAFEEMLDSATRLEQAVHLAPH